MSQISSYSGLKSRSERHLAMLVLKNNPLLRTIKGKNYRFYWYQAPCYDFISCTREFVICDCILLLERFNSTKGSDNHLSDSQLADRSLTDKPLCYCFEQGEGEYLFEAVLYLKVSLKVNRYLISTKLSWLLNACVVPKVWFWIFLNSSATNIWFSASFLIKYLTFRWI